MGTPPDEAWAKLAAFADQVTRADCNDDFRQVLKSLNCFSESSEAQSPLVQAGFHHLRARLYLKIALHASGTWDEPAYQMLNRTGHECTEALADLRKAPNSHQVVVDLKDAVVRNFATAQTYLREWGYEYDLPIDTRGLDHVQHARLETARRPRQQS